MITRYDAFIIALRLARSKNYGPKDTLPGRRPRTLAEKKAKRAKKTIARRIRKLTAH